MGAYAWVACRVFSLTALLIYVVVITIFFYYIWLSSKNIVDLLDWNLFSWESLPSLKDKHDISGQPVMQFYTYSSSSCPLDLHDHAQNLRNGEQTDFKTPTSALSLHVKVKQPPLCVTEEGKIQVPLSLVQEGLKAAASAGVLAHVSESSPKMACPGGWVHTLQLITLCTSDCKSKDPLIIISPCQVSKYYYPHLTYTKNESSSCHRKSWGRCQDQETDNPNSPVC